MEKSDCTDYYGVSDFIIVNSKLPQSEPNKNGGGRSSSSETNNQCRRHLLLHSLQQSPPPSRYFLYQDEFVLGKKLGEEAFGFVYNVSLANI